MYHPPGWGHTAAVPLVFLAFFLFAASLQKTNVKRFVRHPQLAGVAVWAAARCGAATNPGANPYLKRLYRADPYKRKGQLGGDDEIF